MTCAEIDDLAGAIALGAVPDDEWPDVHDHLTTCQRGHGEVKQLMEVATLLLEAAPPMEPPASLRGRILAAARDDLAAPDSSDPDPVLIRRETTPATVTPITAARRRDRRWWQQPAWAAAAAAVLIAAGLGVWNVALRQDLNRTEDRLAAEQRALATLAGAGRAVPLAATIPGAGGMVLRPESGTATLVVHGLTSPAGQTYQVWALRGGRPESLGTFLPDGSGGRVLPLNHDLDGVDAVAITLEPSPNGSAAPTSAPILQAPVAG